MVNNKSFKPPAPAKMAEGKEDRPTREISLTDQQYEEIFSAVLHPSQNCSQPETLIKSPSYAKSPGHNFALSPKECASVENSQNGPNTEIEKHQKDPGEKEKNTDSSSIHTINTDEFTKNATFSTPTTTKIIKPKTFRAALQSLQNKLNDSLSESLSESIDHSLVELWDPAYQLSQLPEGMTKRERLQWLQDRRGTGLWVKCDNFDCDKWRWLDTADPVDVPKIWTCNLNPDKAFASCSVQEKLIPPCIEEDTIHNSFTAGSIVWAKMPGYPWWPAMVDDCPDCEQYYWIDNEYDDVPTWYHVVFFDENEISRRWILVQNILSFKHRPELAKLFKIKPYQRKRFEISTKKAKEALTFSIKERLQRYSFLALWKGEIPEDPDSCSNSDSEIPCNSQDYDRYIKKRVIRRRKKLAGLSIPSRKETPSNKINSSKSTGKKRARKISTDSKISIIESNKPAKVRRTKSVGEFETKTLLPRKNKQDLTKSLPAKVRRTKSNGEFDRKTLSPKTNNQDLNKSLPAHLSNSNIDKDVAIKFYEHCFDLFTQGKDVSNFFNNIFKKNESPEKSSQKKMKDSKAAPVRRSPRLSTESKVSKSSKKSDYDPAKLRRSPRLSTESRKSLSSPKKNGNFNKENKTPKKRSIIKEDKPKKMNKSEETIKKQLFSQKSSTEEKSKEKNKNTKPFVGPKKPFIKKSAKNGTKSTQDLPKGHSDQAEIEILSSNDSSPTITKDKEHSNSFSTGSLNRSFLTQENKKPTLGIRPGLKKPKRTFVTPAKLNEALAILNTSVANLVSANLGPLSETDESD